MSDNTQPRGSDDLLLVQPMLTPIKRRSFFMYAGATAGATALVLAGCSKDDDNTPDTSTVNVGATGPGDAGVLNYAYALEQLEAAFYTRVRTGAYYTTIATAVEKQIFDDLYYHEIIHRELFKAALGTGAIKELTPDFSSINFDTKAGVLGAAKAFEDLGVAAYNGAGRFIQSAAYLVLAGKIVSVEARHAALIRDLVTEGSFVGSDVVTVGSTSLEISKTPSEVAAVANTYLAAGSKLNVSGLV